MKRREKDAGGALQKKHLEGESVLEPEKIENQKVPEVDRETCESLLMCTTQGKDVDFFTFCHSARTHLNG